MTFHLTAKQIEAQKVMAGDARHICLFGGSRSGKTLLIIRAMVIRAMKYDGIRQVVLRHRFNAVRSSVMADTFPKVMAICFPGAEDKWKLDKTEWKVTFANGSEIWIGGLDERERVEKILGTEYAGIFLNEISQIAWASRNMAVTRLAQNVGAPFRVWYDMNPPSVSHWSYKVFIKKVDPDSGGTLAKPTNFAAMLMNPEDNRENLTDDYISELESLPERLRKRFLRGEFLPVAENALWSAELLDRQRVTGDLAIPDMQRIVVSVDPSGADEEHPERDDIGIVIAGLGADGLGYILEDLTINTSPAKWGNIATSAYERHDADLVVGEENYGGAMVRHVIQTARPNTPYKSVKASRGKVVRAEPIASLYETGKVRHVGFFPELEDELCAFTTTGYQGDSSPNRADALVWALTELFPGMVKDTSKDEIKFPSLPMGGGPNAWMG